jgi:hypothetical protein
MFFAKYTRPSPMYHLSERATTPSYDTPDSTRATTLLTELQQKKRNSRRKLLLLLLVGVLIISTVLIAANVQRTGTALNVQVAGQSTIRVDLTQSLPLSPYLRGSNAFPESGTSAKDPTGMGFMSYSPQIVQGLRSSGITMLRFPGGNWGEQHTLSTTQLNDFSTLLNQVGAQGFMQAQLSDSLDKTPVSVATRAERAALQVDYMNNRQSIQRQGTNAPYHPVEDWSIGNEPDLLANQDTGQTYTVDQYTQAFIAYSQAMHEKDPSVQIFGPEISQYSANGGPRDRTGKLWMAGFLEGVSTYQRTHNLPFQLLNGVSFHTYPFGDTQESAQALLNNQQEWNTLIPSLRQLIRQTMGEDLPIAITEINANSATVPVPQNLAALWWAETLGQLMDNQVEDVAFFSTEGVDNPYPLFLSQGLTATPMLHVMQLFAKLQSNLIPIQGNQGPVSVYATQDKGQQTVSLLFLNRTDVNQQISVGTANGSWLPFGPWSGANLTIHGYSMAVLTLHRNGGNETFNFDNAN